MVLEQPHSTMWRTCRGRETTGTELEIPVIASLPDSDSESDSELQWAVGSCASAPQ
jgi:hypothetical protein